jgi:FkbM family methyltransferase
MSALSWSLPNPAVVRGRTIHYPPAARQAVGQFIDAGFEKDTVSVISGLLTPGMTFIDVGAHVGYFALMAAEMVGKSGRVFAFEPEPSLAAVLRKNVDVNGFGRTVTVYESAVADSDSTGLLYVSDDGSMSQSLAWRPKGTRPLPVKLVSLNSFWASVGRPTINVIKVDVEGAEVRVFRGMGRMAAAQDRLAMVFEFNPRLQEAAGVPVADLLQTVHELGFQRVFEIGEGARLEPVGRDSVTATARRLHRRYSYVNLLCLKGEGFGGLPGL